VTEQATSSSGKTPDVKEAPGKFAVSCGLGEWTVVNTGVPMFVTSDFGSGDQAICCLLLPTGEKRHIGSCEESDSLIKSKSLGGMLGTGSFLCAGCGEKVDAAGGIRNNKRDVAGVVDRASRGF
jgi:hypothetical protein